MSDVSVITLVISALCNINTTNVVMPKEEKISCIEFYVNCLTGPNGEYLKKEKAACERRFKIMEQNNDKK